MTEPKRGARIFLVALLALDVMCAIALARLPRRIELREAPSSIPNAAPGLAVVTDREVRFVVTAPYEPADSVLVRVPLGDGSPGDPPAVTVQRLGHDLGLLEPVRGMDAFMPTGPRFAWNGHTLVLAAPSRRIGAQQINVVALGANGIVGEPRVIEGSRPSVGWAHDHFEVTYVTPAPPPDVGRVAWAADIDDSGVITHERIIEPAGQVHDPFVWPNGARTHAHGAEPTEVLVQDGSVVSLARAGGDRVRPWFVLASNGTIDARTVRSRALSGSERAGDYTMRASWGTDTTLEGHLGSSVARPRYVLSHRGMRRVFEASADARVADSIAIERNGVLHIVDPRGFHARFRASDLASLDRHAARLTWLAGALGSMVLALLVIGMAVAHGLAIVVERGHKKVATVAGLTSVSIACAVLYVLWTVSG